MGMGTRRAGANGAIPALLLAALVLPSFLQAASEGDPAGASGDIRFVVDAVSFPRSAGEVHEEVYLLIPNKDLRFEPGESGISEAEIRVRFRFRAWPTGETILVRAIDALLPMSPPDGEDDLQVLQHSFPLPEGPYELRVEVEDRKTLGFGFFHLFWRRPKRGRAVGHFQAKGCRAHDLSISDIQLARSVEADSESEFAKGGVEVIPQPNRLYGALMPVLSFYYEVYDLTEGRDPAGEPYHVMHRVVDAGGAAVLEERQALDAAPGITRFRRSGA
ncbi:MAG: hypothetical protein ABIK65_07815, partial [Candidatus Eisenbacteria bacterium]